MGMILISVLALQINGLKWAVAFLPISIGFREIGSCYELIHRFDSSAGRLSTTHPNAHFDIGKSMRYIEMRDMMRCSNNALLDTVQVGGCLGVWGVMSLRHAPETPTTPRTNFQTRRI